MPCLHNLYFYPPPPTLLRALNVDLSGHLRNGPCAFLKLERLGGWTAEEPRAPSSPARVDGVSTRWTDHER